MDDNEERRQAAIERVEAKRRFKTHAAVYVIVNAFLLIVWAFEGSSQELWPFWTLAGWGLGLALHAWNVYFRGAITEDEIRREMAARG